MSRTKAALPQEPRRSKYDEGDTSPISRKGKMPQRLSVQIVVAKDEETFHAYAPALKGLHVDGATQEEAVENVKEAIAVYLESLHKYGDPLPEGPGLVIQRIKVPNGASLQNIAVQWPSLSLSRIS